MDDIYLCETVDDSTFFVTPLSNRFYREAGGNGLGGAEGYFICTASKSRPDAGFEILAKAASIDAAERIFRALVSFSSRQRAAA